MLIESYYLMETLIILQHMVLKLVVYKLTNGGSLMLVLTTMPTQRHSEELTKPVDEANVDDIVEKLLRWIMCCGILESIIPLVLQNA